MIDLVHDPGGNSEPTNCLYVWIVTHGPGDEAIAAMNGIPMMAATYAVAVKLTPVAEHLARLTGKSLTLMRFDKAQSLERIDP